MPGRHVALFFWPCPLTVLGVRNLEEMTDLFGDRSWLDLFQMSVAVNELTFVLDPSGKQQTEFFDEDRAIPHDTCQVLLGNLINHYER